MPGSIQWPSGRGKLGRTGVSPAAAPAGGTRQAEATVGSGGAGRSRVRRIVRGLFLAAVGVLAGVAWLLWPDFLEVAWIQLPYEFRRRTASLYLDALLVGYALALAGSIGLIAGVLAMRRLSRADAPGRRRRQVRLLALGVAILLSLLALDVGAAAWSAWQRRMPRLPELAGLPEGEPAAVDPVPAPARRPAPTAPGTLTILVAGESSARGEPYHPWLSVGQIVAWKLESVFPGRPIRVDIRARGGATIKMMHDGLAGLGYRPDVLIVFVGHNEFATRFPWMREPGGYYEDDMPALYSPAALRSLLRLSPMCRLALETWDRNRIDLRPPHEATRELVDQPIYMADEYAAILADFGRRLEAIAASLRDDRDAADLHRPGVERRRLRPQPIGARARDAEGRTRGVRPGRRPEPGRWRRSDPAEALGSSTSWSHATPSSPRRITGSPGCWSVGANGTRPGGTTSRPASATACPCDARRTSAAPTARWPRGTRRCCWSTRRRCWRRSASTASSTTGCSTTPSTRTCAATPRSRRTCSTSFAPAGPSAGPREPSRRPSTSRTVPGTSPWIATDGRRSADARRPSTT